METEQLTAGAAAMLIKKLGKEYKRKIAVRALLMDMPFVYNEISGDKGDYLVMDDQGEVVVMDAASFKALYGTARRGRKRKIPATLPPEQPSRFPPIPTSMDELRKNDDPDNGNKKNTGRSPVSHLQRLQQTPSLTITS